MGLFLVGSSHPHVPQNRSLGPRLFSQSATPQGRVPSSSAAVAAASAIGPICNVFISFATAPRKCIMPHLSTGSPCRAACPWCVGYKDLGRPLRPAKAVGLSAGVAWLRRTGGCHKPPTKGVLLLPPPTLSRRRAPPAPPSPSRPRPPPACLPAGLPVGKRDVVAALSGRCWSLGPVSGQHTALGADFGRL